MKLNPDTLEEETEEQQKERQGRTGVVGNGLNVVCFPNPEEPQIQELRSRAACLMRPLAICQYCRHSNFTLFFDGNAPDTRYRLVACPRWRNPGDRQKGREPDYYVAVETAACEKKQLEFCPSCPSEEELVQICSADKTKEGWYSRYRRFRDEEFNDE